MLFCEFITTGHGILCMLEMSLPNRQPTFIYFKRTFCEFIATGILCALEMYMYTQVLSYTQCTAYVHILQQVLLRTSVNQAYPWWYALCTRKLCTLVATHTQCISYFDLFQFFCRFINGSMLCIQERPIKYYHCVLTIENIIILNSQLLYNLLASYSCTHCFRFQMFRSQIVGMDQNRITQVVVSHGQILAMQGLID